MALYLGSNRVNMYSVTSAITIDPPEVEIPSYFPAIDVNYPADVSVVSGTNTTFKAVILHDGNPASYTYQWYVNGSAVSGATSASYTRSNASTGTYTVYCEITNDAGTLRTRTATLTVSVMYLYNKGDKCSAITGGWTGVGGGGITISFDSTKMNIDVTNTSGRDGGICTNSPVNLTNYSTLKAIVTNYTASSDYSAHALYLGINSSSQVGKSVPSFSKSTKISKNGTLSLDISTVSGNQYIAIYSDVAQCDITEIWLE